MINRNISNLSFSEIEFENFKSIYEAAQKNSGLFWQCLLIKATRKMLEDKEIKQLYCSLTQKAKRQKQIVVNCSLSL